MLFTARTTRSTQIQNAEDGDYWAPFSSPLTTRRGGVYLNKDSVRTSQEALRVRYRESMLFTARTTWKNTQIQNVEVGDYWAPFSSPLTTRRGEFI
jgi:hypothetical protein